MIKNQNHKLIILWHFSLVSGHNNQKKNALICIGAQNRFCSKNLKILQYDYKIRKYVQHKTVPSKPIYLP